MSSALDQIIKWSHGLPAWQADGVRRFAHGGISAEGPSPVPAKLGAISGASVGWHELILERILDVQHVNAVKNGSTMPFGLAVSIPDQSDRRFRSNVTDRSGVT